VRRFPNHWPRFLPPHDIIFPFLRAVNSLRDQLHYFPLLLSVLLNVTFPGQYSMSSLSLFSSLTLSNSVLLLFPFLQCNEELSTSLFSPWSALSPFRRGLVWSLVSVCLAKPPPFRLLSRIPLFSPDFYFFCCALDAAALPFLPQGKYFFLSPFHD